MGDTSFEWDERKSNENKTKHGESFDESHSSSEERFLMLGMSSHFRLLVIVHAFRERDSVIRIISARKATRNEGRHYPGRKP